MQPLTPDELRIGLIFVACLMIEPVVFGGYIFVKLCKYIHKYNKPGDFWK